MRTASLGLLLLLGVCISTAVGAVPSWLATGTVTKVDGNTLYFLSRGDSVFRVEVGGSRILSNAGQATTDIRPGDKVRVYGFLIEPSVVRAAQIRVLESNRPPSEVGRGPREVRIVMERDEVVPSGGTSDPCQPPDPACSPRMWEGKGIVIDIDYVGRQVKLQTSDTNYTIDTENAQMVRGTTRIRFGSLNLGDTIWVRGIVVAANVIDGQMLRVLRTVSEAQNAVPLLPVSMVGIVQQIDYPSRTFRLRGPHTPVVVSVDDNTDIYFQSIKKQFNDLKPGTRINMSGTGSLATGYAAQHIQIIGGP